MHNNLKEIGKATALNAIILGGVLIALLIAGSMIVGCATHSARPPTCDSVVTEFKEQHESHKHELLALGEMAPGTLVAVYSDKDRTTQWAMLLSEPHALIPAEDDGDWEFKTRCTLPDGGGSARVYFREGMTYRAENDSANDANKEFN